MRVAEILSDLTSLRVCVRLAFPVLAKAPLLTTALQDPNAALALVSARASTVSEPVSASNGLSPQTSRTQQGEQDVDLRRARDLIALHSSVKLAHGNGIDRELLQARQEVERVLQDL